MTASTPRRTALVLAFVALLGAGCGSEPTGSVATSEEDPVSTHTPADGTDDLPEESTDGSRIFPAAIGPEMRVDERAHNYPFIAHALQAETTGELPGEPAPAGMKHLVVAVQVEGLSADRSIEPPLDYMFAVRWPDPDCRPLWDETDTYACNSESMDSRSIWLPVDAENYADGEPVDVIPPGQPYAKLLSAIVPEEVDLSTARLTFHIADGFLPLSGLPEFAW